MKKLENKQMEVVQGGGWADDIDLMCNISGIFGLAWQPMAGHAAFCAGWSLGRQIQ